MTTPTGRDAHQYVLRVSLSARVPPAVGHRVDRLLQQFAADLAATAPGVQPHLERFAPRKSDLPVLEIDVDARRVFVGDVLVPLAHKEFEILRHLVARPGEVVRREEIVDAIDDGVEAKPASRTIDVHVHRIRTKLALCGDCISTVRGIGYRFNASSSVTVK